MSESAHSPLRRRSGRVTVQGVRFRRGESGSELLHGLSLEVPAGELVVVLGPPGSGKTTLLRLLLGDLVPDAGSLRIDGMTLAEVGRRRWRSTIACVTRSESRFAGSIADNIGFLAGRRDPRRIAECARRARLEEELDALPEGPGTPIDEIGEADLRVFWPRVQLARALYRRPRVLLWDDADDADPQAVRLWWQAMQALTLTRIVVTRWADAIAGAERVLVLGDGRIAQDLRRPASA